MTDSHADLVDTLRPAAVADPERWAGEQCGCLYSYALVRVRRPEVAEDLVQETLLVAVRSREHFAERSNVRTWLVGILKNKIRDHFRTLGRETNFTDLEVLDGESWCGSDGDCPCMQEGPKADWPSGGEEAMRRAEFWQALQCGLEKLPERVVQVFSLREIDGVPGKEICEMLNISEANLWVMLHRARAALRHDLELGYFEGKGITMSP